MEKFGSFCDWNKQHSSKLKSEDCCYPYHLISNCIYQPTIKTTNNCQVKHSIQSDSLIYLSPVDKLIMKNRSKMKKKQILSSSKSICLRRQQKNTFTNNHQTFSKKKNETKCTTILKSDELSGNKKGLLTTKNKPFNVECHKNQNNSSECFTERKSRRLSNLPPIDVKIEIKNEDLNSSYDLVLLGLISNKLNKNTKKKKNKIENVDSEYSLNKEHSCLVLDEQNLKVTPVYDLPLNDYQNENSVNSEKNSDNNLIPILNKDTSNDCLKSSISIICTENKFPQTQNYNFENPDNLGTICNLDLSKQTYICDTNNSLDREYNELNGFKSSETKKMSCKSSKIQISTVNIEEKVTFSNKIIEEASGMDGASQQKICLEEAEIKKAPNQIKTCSNIKLEEILSPHGSHFRITKTEKPSYPLLSNCCSEFIDPEIGSCLLQTSKKIFKTDKSSCPDKPYSQITKIKDALVLKETRCLPETSPEIDKTKNVLSLGKRLQIIENKNDVCLKGTNDGLTKEEKISCLPKTSLEIDKLKNVPSPSKLLEIIEIEDAVCLKETHSRITKDEKTSCLPKTSPEIYKTKCVSSPGRPLEIIDAVCLKETHSRITKDEKISCLPKTSLEIDKLKNVPSPSKLLEIIQIEDAVCLKETHSRITKDEKISCLPKTSLEIDKLKNVPSPSKLLEIIQIEDAVCLKETHSRITKDEKISCLPKTSLEIDKLKNVPSPRKLLEIIEIENDVCLKETNSGITKEEKILCSPKTSPEIYKTKHVSSPGKPLEIIDAVCLKETYSRITKDEKISCLPKTSIEIVKLKNVPSPSKLLEIIEIEDAVCLKETHSRITKDEKSSCLPKTSPEIDKLKNVPSPSKLEIIEIEDAVCLKETHSSITKNEKISCLPKTSLEIDKLKNVPSPSKLLEIIQIEDAVCLKETHSRITKDEKSSCLPKTSPEIDKLKNVPSSSKLEIIEIEDDVCLKETHSGITKEEKISCLPEKSLEIVKLKNVPSPSKLLEIIEIEDDVCLKETNSGITKEEKISCLPEKSLEIVKLKNVPSPSKLLEIIEIEDDVCLKETNSGNTKGKKIPCLPKASTEVYKTKNVSSPSKPLEIIDAVCLKETHSKITKDEKISCLPKTSLEIDKLKNVPSPSKLLEIIEIENDVCLKETNSRITKEEKISCLPKKSLEIVKLENVPSPSKLLEIIEIENDVCLKETNSRITIEEKILCSPKTSPEIYKTKCVSSPGKPLEIIDAVCLKETHSGVTKEKKIPCLLEASTKIIVEKYSLKPNSKEAEIGNTPYELNLLSDINVLNRTSSPKTYLKRTLNTSDTPVKYTKKTLIDKCLLETSNNIFKTDKSSCPPKPYSQITKFKDALVLKETRCLPETSPEIDKTKNVPSPSKLLEIIEIEDDVCLKETKSGITIEENILCSPKTSPEIYKTKYISSPGKPLEIIDAVCLEETYSGITEEKKISCLPEKSTEIIVEENPSCSLKTNSKQAETGSTAYEFNLLSDINISNKTSSPKTYLNKTLNTSDIPIKYTKETLVGRPQLKSFIDMSPKNRSVILDINSEINLSDKISVAKINHKQIVQNYQAPPKNYPKTILINKSIEEKDYLKMTIKEKKLYREKLRFANSLGLFSAEQFEKVLKIKEKGINSTNSKNNLPNSKILMGNCTESLQSCDFPTSEEEKNFPYSLGHSNQTNNTQYSTIHITTPILKPEKIPKLIRPFHKCLDMCCMCYKKFCLKDTPFHLYQINDRKKQAACLKSAPRLGIYSCLCTFCFQQFEKQSCIQYLKKESCFIINCNETAHICKLTYTSFLRIKNLLLLKGLLDITECHLCGNRALNKFEVYQPEARIYQIVFNTDQIPINVKCDSFVCKPCHVYLVWGSCANEKKFDYQLRVFKKHRETVLKRICDYHKLKFPSFLMKNVDIIDSNKNYSETISSLPSSSSIPSVTLTKSLNVQTKENNEDVLLDTAIKISRLMNHKIFPDVSSLINHLIFIEKCRMAGSLQMVDNTIKKNHTTNCNNSLSPQKSSTIVPSSLGQYYWKPVPGKYKTIPKTNAEVNNSNMKIMSLNNVTKHNLVRRYDENSEELKKYKKLKLVDCPAILKKNEQNIPLPLTSVATTTSKNKSSLSFVSKNYISKIQKDQSKTVNDGNGKQTILSTISATNTSVISSPVTSTIPFINTNCSVKSITIPNICKITSTVSTTTTATTTIPVSQKSVKIIPEKIITLNGMNVPKNGRLIFMNRNNIISESTNISQNKLTFVKTVPKICPPSIPLNMVSQTSSINIHSTLKQVNPK